MLLAGDIGGSKTTLAVVSAAAGPERPLAKATFLSAEHGSLSEVARAFLAQLDLTVERACFGVAGPVVGGRAKVTNLPWALDAADLRDELGLQSVHLVNDLEATAWAVPWLPAADTATLQAGEARAGGAIAVIAPGTGLGQAFLTWDGATYRAFPSEGGHTSYAPTTPLEADLLRFLLDRFGHVSYERVCSGIGLPNIYEFLKASGRGDEPSWLAQALATAPDPTPIIAGAALAGEDHVPLCQQALELFVASLGTAAANLALTVLATGGVYLGGGIPPRILPALRAGPFLPAFRHKGRFSDLLASVPVRVILNPETALLGAARYGLTR